MRRVKKPTEKQLNFLRELIFRIHRKASAEAIWSIVEFGLSRDRLNREFVSDLISRHIDGVDLKYVLYDIIKRIFYYEDPQRFNKYHRIFELLDSYIEATGDISVIEPLKRGDFEAVRHVIVRHVIRRREK